MRLAAPVSRVAFRFRDTTCYGTVPCPPSIGATKGAGRDRPRTIGRRPAPGYGLYPGHARSGLELTFFMAFMRLSAIAAVPAVPAGRSVSGAPRAPAATFSAPIAWRWIEEAHVTGAPPAQKQGLAEHGRAGYRLAAGSWTRTFRSVTDTGPDLRPFSGGGRNKAKKDRGLTWVVS